MATNNSLSQNHGVRQQYDSLDPKQIYHLPLSAFGFGRLRCHSLISSCNSVFLFSFFSKAN